MCKNKVQLQKGLSLPDFMDKFGTEAQCQAALEAAKWPNGFSCAYCGHHSFSRITRGRAKRQCNKCKHQTSLMSGTIFQDTKLPLTKWFLGMHLMTQSKNGISQMELARQLGIGINAAALMYHKLAQVMLERDEDKPLSGNIEIDDAYWGGKSSGGKRGRGAPKKTPFLAAVSKVADKPDQIKLSVVKGFRAVEITQWSEKNLKVGSSVLSDGLACFRGVKKAGFNHQFLVVGNSRDTKKTSAFDWVNTILGNLKTALAGTYHKLSAHHLQRHLATFQYRFNRRYRLKDILPRLVWVALRTPPMPRRHLTSAAYQG